MVLTDTGDDSMTGARIKRALAHVRGQHFFATYGDGVADVDMTRSLGRIARRGGSPR